MPAVLPFLPAIIGGAGALFKGIGQTQDMTSRETGQFSNQGFQSGLLDRKQRLLMRQLFGALSGVLEQGPTVSQAERNLGRTQINNTFDATRPRLESALTARGFGDSGKMGQSFKSLELDRAKGFQNLEANLRNEAQNRFANYLGLAQNFIQPRSFESTSSGTSSGTFTDPGNLFGGIGTAAGGIGGILEYLRRQGMLGGGGAGGLHSLGGGLAGGGGDFGY